MFAHRLGMCVEEGYAVAQGGREEAERQREGHHDARVASVRVEDQRHVAALFADLGREVFGVHRTADVVLFPFFEKDQVKDLTILGRQFLQDFAYTPLALFRGRSMLARASREAAFGLGLLVGLTGRQYAEYGRDRVAVRDDEEVPS